MSIVTFSRIDGTTVGRIYRVPYTSTAALNDPPDRLFLPAGVYAINRPPSVELFTADDESWALAVGGHCDNIAQLQDFRFVRQSIRPPATIPSVAAAAGPGVTGSAICYCRFLDQPNNRRSPLSGATAAVTLTNQSRAWTNIPTIPPDELFYIRGTTTVNASQTINLTSGELLGEVLQVGDQVAVSSAPTTWVTVLTVASDSQFTTSAVVGNGTTQTITVRRSCGVTHVELVVSMDGGTARVAATVALGTTSLTENTATLSLGAAATESFSKFPFCRYNAIYNQRQWMAGDYRHPDRVYYSLVNSPEDMSSYMPTRNGAPVKALWKVGDALYVGTNRDIQVIQGMTSDDFNITIAEPDLVVLDHHAIGKQDNYAIVPTTRAIYLHTGLAFTDITTAFSTAWKEATSDTNSIHWTDAISVVDPIDGVFKLCATDPTTTKPSELTTINLGVSPSTLYWVLDVSSVRPQAGGTYSPPQLLFDSRKRKDTCAFRIIHPSYGDVVVTGSRDGMIRFEVPFGNDTDDNGDTDGKLLEIFTKHYSEGNEGGDLEEGREWQELWMFVESEDYEWSVSARAGDEKAYTSTSPDFTATIDASAVTNRVPQSLHNWRMDQVHGRGIRFLIKVLSAASRSTTANSPTFVFRGLGGYHAPGKSFRKTTSVGGGG